MNFPDDGFDYGDADWISATRRSLGLNDDPDLVQALIDGTIPSVRAQEFGLLTPDELEEREMQLHLAEDLRVIGDYGRRHPETWGGARHESEGILAVVVALFTWDIDAHLVRLQSLVRHPDRLRVRRVPWSLQELNQVQDEILAERHEGRTGVGMGDGIVTVFLKKGFEAEAQRLRERYGTRVEVITGVEAYALVELSAK